MFCDLLIDVRQRGSEYKISPIFRSQGPNIIQLAQYLGIGHLNTIHIYNYLSHNLNSKHKGMAERKSGNLNNRHTKVCYSDKYTISPS